MKSHLESDKADEAKAIKTYGNRQKQHPEKAGMYKEMQNDEQDHFRKLSHALTGLKQVAPKNKDGDE